MENSPARPRALTLIACASLAAALSSGIGPTAAAKVVTCQGQAATIVGPTDGQNTTGTEGDDVMVAPLHSNSTVAGLGGNDTICLVNGPTGPSRDPFVTVLAGAGHDSVVNETTPPRGFRVELGTGADHFTGKDAAEIVYGAGSWDGNGIDTEVDVIETGGGDDLIFSGSLGAANQDVISTGAGGDMIHYWSAAGGAIDNGPDADGLVLVGPWTGELHVDNVQRRASIGGSTVLTWTAIKSFAMRAVPGSHVTFVGSDADETLNIAGTVLDLAAPSSITTGDGDDGVRLENYLPSGVDTGDGYDNLTYLACHRAYVALSVSAECLTSDGREVSTALAGIEYFYGRTADGLTVQGSARAERVSALARYVLVRSGPGADRVYAGGRRTAQAIGGRGSDRLKVAGGRESVARGGRGADVLRGSEGSDRLFGGPGRDTAYGRDGRRDLCVAEVRIGCELP